MASINDTSVHTFNPTDIIDSPEGTSASILTYGSLIYLTFTEENLVEYYAYSEGLTKTKVLLKTKEIFEREGSNMRGLFRIYPSFAQNEYIKAKTKFQDIVGGDDEIELNKRRIRAEIPRLIKNNNEMSRKVQDLEHKVEVKRQNQSKHSVSVMTEEESFAHDKENLIQRSVGEEVLTEALRKRSMEKVEHAEPQAEKKSAKVGWVQYKEAREVKKQGAEGRRQLKLEDDMRITEVVDDEVPVRVPKESDYEGVQHIDRVNEIAHEDRNLNIRGRDFRQQEEQNDSDNVKVEDLEEKDIEAEINAASSLTNVDHQYRKEVPERISSNPIEKYVSSKQEIENEEEHLQAPARVQSREQRQKYNPQDFRAGDLEDDKVLKPEKGSVRTFKAGHIEEDRDSRR